ncbi:ATP-binding protein [Streptomyces sp. NPDC020983]|uniref:ATP-binding protein n=1 Tax=Streptomyces sp. NPDC020983 TaxID=3365106 RepID=UPI0037994FC4
MLSPDTAIPVLRPPRRAGRDQPRPPWSAGPRDGGPHHVAGCLPLPHRPEAGRQARRSAEGLMERWRVPAGTADDVLLVVSELVTNALNHALPAVCLHLSQLPCGILRVEVADGGPRGVPLEREPDAGGRGLTLVGALAQSHGRLLGPAGALAWAEFAGPATPPLPGPRPPA